MRFRWVIRNVFAAILVVAGPCAADTARMATMSPPGSPSRFVYEHLLDYVSTQSGGDYKIEPFFNGELGPEESYFNAMRRGRIQLSAVSGQGVGTAVPEYAVLRAPYLFESFDELAFVYDTYLTDVLAGLFAEKDMVHLQWAANGWENLYAQKKVELPADVAGYRIRVPLEPNAALFFGAAQADVIQIPFTDIIQSLQTGLIDGGESTTLMYVQAGIYTEAPHFTLTQHGFSLAVYAANKRWFERLPQSAQDLFRKAYMNPRDAYPILRAQTQDMLDQQIAKTIEVTTLTERQRAEWQRTTAQAVDQIIRQSGGKSADLYALISEGKAEYAARRDQTRTPE